MKSVDAALTALCAFLIAPAPALARAETRVEAPTSLNNVAPVRITGISLDAADGVFVSDPNRQRLLDKIESRVAAIQPAAAPDAPAYRMFVILTRFSRGQAAARLALIGLGSVHVEGKVQLFDSANKQVGEFAITKGLVLGGIAGGLVSAGSVEDRFAHAVAATITPKPPLDAKTTGKTTAPATSK